MSKNTGNIKSGQLPLNTEEVKDYLHIIARSFEVIILGKMSRIADRTPNGPRKNGKVYVIQKVEMYLYEISPKYFEGKTKEEIKKILEQKITEYLCAILAEEDLYNKEFGIGMKDSLLMIGGYYQASILKI